MKRKMALGLVLTVLAMSLAGCGAKAPEAAGQTGAEKSEELYSMVVFTKGAEYFNWCYAGMKDAAASIGSHIQVELQGPAEWDASLEARAVDQVVAKNPTGILVASADETTLNSSIQKALDAGSRLSVSTVMRQTAEDWPMWERTIMILALPQPGQWRRC